MNRKIVTFLGESLPGAVSGALVGAYHYQVTRAFRLAKPICWHGREIEPLGAGEGAVLGALAGALVFSLLRRRWSRLPLPLLALLSATGVAFVGLFPPCEHRFEQVIALDEARVLAVHRKHDLMGLRRGGSYVTGASIEPHSLEIHGTPRMHRVVDIF